jgi:hypothetical protein
MGGERPAVMHNDASAEVLAKKYTKRAAVSKTAGGALVE